MEKYVELYTFNYAIKLYLYKTTIFSKVSILQKPVSFFFFFKKKKKFIKNFAMIKNKRISKYFTLQWRLGHYIDLLKKLNDNDLLNYEKCLPHISKKQ